MRTEETPPIHTSVPITVQHVSSGTQDRHPGVLVGNIQRDFLVIAGLRDLQLAIGDTIVVRMIQNSAASGFQSHVQGVVEAPVRLYLIAYPEHVETVNLRKSERLKVFFPASVRAQAGPEATSDQMLLNGMLLNLSAGGCCFTSKRAVQPSSKISIAFSLPGESHVHNLTGTVLTSVPGGGIFAQRVRWMQEGKDLPELIEIRKWIEQNVGFALGAAETAAH